MIADLSAPEGREAFLRLVEVSDVVIENNSPGAFDRARLSWDDLRAVNPRLVMVRMPAFGLSGPYRDYRAFGTHAEAMVGQTLLRRLHRRGAGALRRRAQRRRDGGRPRCGRRDDGPASPRADRRGAADRAAARGGVHPAARRVHPRLRDERRRHVGARKHPPLARTSRRLPGRRRGPVDRDRCRDRRAVRLAVRGPRQSRARRRPALRERGESAGAPRRARGAYRRAGPPSATRRRCSTSCRRRASALRRCATRSRYSRIRS